MHLLIAAIAAWTTPYVEDAIAAVRAEGIDVLEEYIAHISPIAWEHVHLLGQYTFYGRSVPRRALNTRFRTFKKGRPGSVRR